MTQHPEVGIIMGSDSDLIVMQEAAKVFDEFHIHYELTIVSAHRTPKRMYSYAQSAIKKGLKVIIAGAGGAAHLPGMIAALTVLPVIGVPVKSRAMKGIDSLYSIVQMPPGIPVATVAIDGAKNAALLAMEILAISDINLQKKLQSYRDKQDILVNEKALKLEKVGYEKYLEVLKQ